MRSGISSNERPSELALASLRQILPLDEHSIDHSASHQDLPTQAQCADSCPALYVDRSHLPFSTSDVEETKYERSNDDEDRSGRTIGND